MLENKQTNNSFINLMEEKLNNISITSNGMEGYKTTYHPLVDFNFKIASYRHLSSKEINNDIDNIMESNDSKYILKYLFFLRDIKSGLGERRLFRVALKRLLEYDFSNKKEIITSLINNDISSYGRYDDLLIFIDTPYKDILINKIKEQLKLDVYNMECNNSISLLAKWLPSENTSSLETRTMARKLIKLLGYSEKYYRKTLSTLRRYLNVVEVSLSKKAYQEIDYAKVPSCANLMYSDLFLKKDTTRRLEFLESLRNNVKGVKINSSVNFPHNIVSKYGKEYNESLEQLWKNLDQIDGLNNTIVVRDGSGSMTSTIGNTNVTALDVSTALAIYTAEKLKGEFKNKFITFSHNAKVVTLPNTSLFDKLNTCYRYTECSNTNIENVLELILNTAVNNNLKNKDLPNQILIISDMEFDPLSFNGDENVFTYMQDKFKEKGYNMPKLVFWNVASITNTIPLIHNENGVLLISGFSPNTLKITLSGELDPFNAIIRVINSSRYESIPLLNL